MGDINYITRNVFAKGPDVFHSRGGRSCGLGGRKGGLDCHSPVRRGSKLSPRPCRS